MHKKLIGLFLTIALCSTAFSACTNRAAEELKSLNNELMILKGQNEKLKKQLEDVKSKESAVGASKQPQNKENLQEYNSLYHQPIAFGIDDPTGRYYYNQDRKLDGSYTINEPLERLNQIRGFLKSFKLLTDKARKMFTEKELHEIGNTDPGMQLLGFNNVPVFVKGALYDQVYIIKKMDFGLAIKQYEDGEISKDILESKAEAYKKAKSEYEEYIKTATFGD